MEPETEKGYATRAEFALKIKRYNNEIYGQEPEELTNNSKNLNDQFEDE